MKVNTKAVEETLKALESEARKAMRKAGMEFVDKVEAESIIETPVDTGHLRGSHFKRDEVQGTKTTFIFGNSAEYAFYVHENLTAKHPVGKAQFIVDPLMRNAAKYFSVSADEVERAIRKVARR